MKAPKLIISAVAVFTILTASLADATDDLARARAATAPFHDLAAAEAAGYGGPLEDLAGLTCIENPGTGVMGIHYVNGGLVGDARSRT